MRRPDPPPSSDRAPVWSGKWRAPSGLAGARAPPPESRILALVPQRVCGKKEPTQAVRGCSVWGRVQTTVTVFTRVPRWPHTCGHTWGTAARLGGLCPALTRLHSQDRLLNLSRAMSILCEHLFLFSGYESSNLCSFQKAWTSMPSKLSLRQPGETVPWHVTCR